MEQTSPIKRHQALVALSRDHHFGLLLVWKIKQGLAKHVALQRISSYVTYFFEHDLRAHFEEEETLLFPKLPADNPLRQRAEQEHRKIYELVKKLQDDEPNKKLLEQFSDTLKEHIRFEERELFTLVQQSLTDAELESLAIHDNSRSLQADANWYDVFWVNSEEK